MTPKSSSEPQAPLNKAQVLQMSADALEAAIRYHNKRYWLDNQPEIDDVIYDLLVERLRALNPDAPVLHAIGPAGAYDEDDADGTNSYQYGEKAVHSSPMLSLDKAYDEDSVQKWFEKFEGGAWVSPKIDGLACSLRYDADGRLSMATTRGDGVRGDIITENIKRVADLPTKIDGANVEIRGEVYMPISVFKTFEDQYANPRNLAAGGLKQKDASQTANYKLRFFAYDVLGDGAPKTSETDKRAKLSAWGFRPVDAQFIDNKDAVQAAFDQCQRARHTLDYETDGVVYKTDRLDEQLRLGSTAHHPRYAIAYKYQGEAGISRLLEIEWSVARTHVVSPVAVVEPVVLSGATVTRATLHNLAFFEGLGLTIGATIQMVRRGGVIPHVERVLTPGNQEIVIPKICPCGAGPTERRADFLYCMGASNCKAAQVGLLKHFITVIECKGFGEKIIEQLYDIGLVQTPADFYRLRPEAMMQLERMGDILAQKLVANVQARRALPLAMFLRALGIDSLGKVSAQWVAQTFLTLDATRNAPEPTIAAIFGLGDLTAHEITEGLKARAAVIDDLLQFVEVLPAQSADAAASASSSQSLPWTGQKFLFTGALDTMPRKDAEAQVIALGGSVPNSVQKDLSFLILGDADLAKFQGGWRSAKLKKAEQYNAQGSTIQIIGERDFLSLLAQSKNQTMPNE